MDALEEEKKKGHDTISKLIFFFLNSSSYLKPLGCFPRQ